MPIQHSIDSGSRRVVARVRGVLTAQDMLAYQELVWTRSEVAGFDELIDMTDADPTDAPPSDLLRRLAGISAAMDAPGRTRLAIVATHDLAFGLARMYETYRTSEPHGRREVGVFRTLAEAVTFLDRTRKA